MRDPPAEPARPASARIKQIPFGVDHPEARTVRKDRPTASEQPKGALTREELDRFARSATRGAGRPGHEGVPHSTIAAAAIVNAVQHLHGIRFPAARRDVEAIARTNGADASALEEIRALPSNARFRNAFELFHAIGEETKDL